jgi:choline dehydrogenase-like flavoprotein
MRDGLLALLCVAAVSGCSYDWAVGPLGADAAGDVAPQVDAEADAVSLDGSTDGPAEVSPADAPPDVSEAAPPTCTTLEAQVQQARAAALACNGTTSACQTEVTDECGCVVVVGGTTATTPTENYLAAIGQLKQSSCTPVCPGCPTDPMKGLCVLSDAGSGALACYQ